LPKIINKEKPVMKILLLAVLAFFGVQVHAVDIRETARSFAPLDLKGDAVKVLCTSKYAAVADACKKD